MSRAPVLACMVAGILASSAAAAQEGMWDADRWVVRAGGHYLSPKGSNGSIDLGDVLNVYDIDIDGAASFSFSAEYLFDRHWGLEFLGSGPYTLDFAIEGDNGSGETGLYVPMLSMLYHFNADGRVRPYVGAGVHATTFFSEEPEGISLDDEVSIGAVVGLDVGFTDNWFGSLDVRWLDMDTELAIDNVTDDIGTVGIDPLMVGLMVGYRFGHREHYVAPAPVAAPVVAAAPVAAAAPAACVDGDADGVCDTADKCPGTPAGDPVDANGCSMVSRLALYFDFDSAELRPESITELERVVQFMNDIPGATALIEGHTDALGSDAYNYSLSGRRAKAVYDYLASRGVDPARLQSAGKGESQPVADNATEAGRQQNRRVMLIRTDGGR